MKLIDKLNELFELADKEGIEYAYPSDLIHGEIDKQFFESNGIKAELLEEYGGEDCGSEYYAVIKFSTSEETVIIKFDGWYASYHGADYLNHYEVKPVDTTVTMYKPIK